MELVVRMVVGFFEVIWSLVTRRGREREADDRTLAEVDRVNAWLRTQPNSIAPKQEDPAP